MERTFTSCFGLGGLLLSTISTSLQAGTHDRINTMESWVAQYNGEFSYWEEVTDVAVSPDGVVVAGYEYTDYVTRAFATVKYDLDGKKTWSRNYGLGGTNGSAQANAVTADLQGNVLVTGWSFAYVPGPPEEIICDAATLKYDAAGNLLWVHRFRLPGHNNQPQDIIIDSAGNAYVAGAAWIGDSNSPDGGFDLMLLKYSPDGTLLWHRTIGYAGTRFDAGYSIALDASGNPVIAGYTTPFLGPFPPSYGYLVKFNKDGDLLWEREHESYTNASTWWRVAINQAGQIYAFGEIAPPGGLHHLWTSKYDSNGNLIWDRHYDGSSSGSNFAGGMALTPAGGVTICGTSDDIDSQGGVQNIVTIQYQADGTQSWQRLERAGYAQAHGSDVAIDLRGRTFVTGYAFNDNGFEDMVTLCYDPQGELTSTLIYADPNGRSDRASAIALKEEISTNDSLSVFVIGDAWVGFENYYDFTTIRYSMGPVACAADISGDGSVSVADLLAVISAWGPCNNCAADINDDGQVNVSDLLAVISAWGPCS